MSKMFRKISIYTCAVFVTAVASSIFSTQFVIAGLQNIGVDIELYTRLSMTIDDLAILQILLLVIAVCFLIGFLIASYCKNKVGGNRTAWYVASGGISLLITILIIETIFEWVPIAGARTTFGLLTQVFAGGIGGFVFSYFTKINSNADE